MKLISAVFHPLLIATYLIATFLFITPELLPRIQEEIALHFLLVVFLITGLIPMLSIILLRRFNYISSYRMDERKDRALPFTFILFYYGAASYLFLVKLEMGFLFNLVMISETILILILLLITLKFKISIHAATIWSAVGIFSGLLVSQIIEIHWIYYTAIVLAGITSMSRLSLNSHSPKEVWSGMALGFCYSFLILLFLT